MSLPMRNKRQLWRSKICCFETVNYFLILSRLRKLQGVLLDGGKRAADKDLKERRLKKKKAAEKRLKVLGEALGHVDDEDGVLVKVYDDIQTELQEKTAALKKMKQRVRGLNSEISDLQSEFERDRQDYLDTIRKQDQQIKLIESILDKIHPTVRKDCNYRLGVFTLYLVLPSSSTSVTSRRSRRSLCGVTSSPGGGFPI